MVTKKIVEEVPADEPPARIALKDSAFELITQRGITLPWYVKTAKSFRFHPESFSIGNANTGKLKAKLFDSTIQEKAIMGFLNNPNLPCTYGIGSEPDSVPGMYFAAYLLHHYLKTFPNTLPRWYDMKDDFDAIKATTACTFLVITGVYHDLGYNRREKLRDLLSTFDRIPKLVVVTGEDPVTFFYTKVNLPLTHLFYSPSSVYRRDEEVV